uniref:Uncharacterized protein n=2 Tax=Oryza TaxID=4527 RepID=Q109T4_ORYSJ|nr:hypothetical protein LOC_Os10g21574 [Oryza sativa Japonica Group]
MGEGKGEEEAAGGKSILSQRNAAAVTHPNSYWRSLKEGLCEVQETGVGEALVMVVGIGGSRVAAEGEVGIVPRQFHGGGSSGTALEKHLVPATSNTDGTVLTVRKPPSKDSHSKVIDHGRRIRMPHHLRSQPQV